MKRVFIEAFIEGDFSVSKDILRKLPKRIGMVFPVQCALIAEKLKSMLEKEGIVAIIGKGNQKTGGQILGCDVSSVKQLKDVDAVLYIGSGKFHPIAVALETDKPVFCLNPENGEFSWDVRKDADRIKKQNRVKIIRFLHAKNIGILISTKPGQFNTVWVDELKRKYPEKIFYTFLFDTLQPGYLEDFPFIDFFVATACPRIQEDHKKVIDFKEIRSMDLGV